MNQSHLVSLGRQLLRPATFSQYEAAGSLGLHVSVCSLQVQKQTRLRVVDNSAIGKAAMLEGKPPKVIHVYSKLKYGYTGDKVLVAIKGEKKKGIIVGVRQNQKPLNPKFDSNNVVLVDESGSPLGTRILVPIPTFLRKSLKDMSRPKGADYTKLLSIATRFV